MSRRKSGVEDLISLAAMLPWPVALLAAPLSYLVLHVVAVTFASPIHATSPGQFDAVIIHALVGVASAVLQLVVPIVFLVAAAASALRRRVAYRLAADVEAGGMVALRDLSWPQFEQVVGEFFRREGCSITENFKRGPDGGVDLVVRRADQKLLVQCKHWRSRSVGVSVVRELFGVVAARKFSGGYVVSSGTFTADAKSFAVESGIKLIDGSRLAECFGHVELSEATHHGGRAHVFSAAPRCPACGDAMVRRIARRGEHAGSEFWGCTHYPNCREIVPLDAV
jgi:restriction system protein